MKKEIGKSIVCAFKSLKMYTETNFLDYPLGNGQLGIIIETGKNPGITQKELSEILGIDKATLVKPLKKFEEKGYINRVQNCKDKRVYNIYLTEKGKELYPKTKEFIKGVESFLDGHFTSEEKEMFLSFLERIETGLKK